MMNVNAAPAPVETRVTDPQPPNLTKDDIRAQFWLDINGKEVQTAETYSHSWIANQFGHVCLGIFLGGLLGFVSESVLDVVLPFPWDFLTGSLIAVVPVAFWEWRAYQRSVEQATCHFPVDRKLLRDNAKVATYYMVLGVASAFVYRYFALTPGAWLGLSNKVWFAISFGSLVLIGIRLALPWLHQKIVWQKAGLPYLFRLAETQPTIEKEDATELQGLIDSGPPPARAPYQIVIGGPIGAGRTQLSAGIGTELAFKDMTVRYLTLATLLEFAARSKASHFSDDIGPANIAYWRWSQAQAVIIDDIGPLLTPKAQTYDEHVTHFRQILNDQLSSVRAVLARCHTVWVIGDPRGDGEIAKNDHALDQFAREIRLFCEPLNPGEQEVLVAQLDHGEPARIPKPRVRTRKIVA